MSAAVVVGVAVSGLSACGAGFDAQTDLVTGNFTNAEVGDVLIRAAVLVQSATGSDAAFVAGLVNEGTTTDVLTGLAAGPREVSDPAPVSIDVQPDIVLSPGELVSVGGTGTGDPQVRVPGLGDVARVGAFLAVTLTFRDAGPVRLEVQYADAANYLLPAAPTPTASPIAPGTPEALRRTPR